MTDQLLKHLRRVPVRGIAHAFNGSLQQAHAFLDLGFKLGFGGATDAMAADCTNFVGWGSAFGMRIDWSA